MILATTTVSKTITVHNGSTRVRATSLVEPVVYFFLDFWNITISAAHLAASHGDGIYNDHRVRLSCPNLRALVERDRRWGAGYAAAAVSNPCAGLCKQMRQVGIDLEVSECGVRSGREQNVDERIQLEMYRLQAHSVPRGIVVLATGDGAGSAEGRGFLPVLQQLSESGFDIEVMSWEHSFHGKLRDWAESHGRAIVLDPFYKDLTFIDGGRNASSVNALYKKVALHGLN